MNFINNKYTKTYFLIIARAQDRFINGYTEKHHIIPKSLGGADHPTNLVSLTAREHFICHRLLVKMTTGTDKRKMSRALWALSQMDKLNARYRPNSRVFQLIREEYVKTLIGRKLPSEVVEKIRASNTGKTQSDETKRKRAESRTGFRNTKETKQKMREAAERRWANTFDDTARIQKIKEARAKQKITTVQVTCPHCGKVGGNRIMPRYHFDNCKFKS